MTPLLSFYNAYSTLILFSGVAALLALSIYVTLMAGQLSLGNAALAAIGGYAAAIPTRNFHAPLWAALLGGACAVMTMGAERLAPLGCGSGAGSPSPAAVSVFWFGLYAVGFGLSLATLAKPVLARLGFPRRQGPWMAVVGGAPMLIGLFYVMAALFELRPFFWLLVFARTTVFLVCMRLRFRRHQASGLLLAAALPDLFGAFWTAWALADTQAQALGLILGLTNLIVAWALYLFPTETRFRLGFVAQAGNWLPLAAVLIGFWGLYEILAAALVWLPLVWTAALCRLLFGAVCLLASLAHGTRRGAVEGPWRLALAGLGYAATALLLFRALIRGL